MWKIMLLWKQAKEAFQTIMTKLQPLAKMQGVIFCLLIIRGKSNEKDITKFDRF
jgi:hypothetical protein